MQKENTFAQREFFSALGSGQTELVRRLVAEDHDLLNAYNYAAFGATPITQLCFQDDRKMIEVLLELGADINRRSDWEMGPWSPLHAAVYARRRDLADFLLSRGAAIDAHVAAGLGRADELLQLLQRDAGCVAERGGDGCQPLHFADTPQVAQLLLDHGADIDARCIDHYSTPVQYLAELRPDVARFLFSKGAQADIFSAVMADDEQIVRQLIQNQPIVLGTLMNQKCFPPGPDHDVHNVMTFTVGQHTTPMHAAARANRPKMVKLLADAGLGVNLRGGYDDGMPLHLAAWHDHPQVAQALLDQDAALDALSGSIHHNSPAGWAIVAGSADVFCLLMDRGAQVLPWFMDDALAALDGKFRMVKPVPMENHQRIMKRLTEV